MGRRVVRAGRTTHQRADFAIPAVLYESLAGSVLFYYCCSTAFITTLEGGGPVLVFTSEAPAERSRTQELSPMPRPRPRGRARTPARRSQSERPPPRPRPPLFRRFS